MPPLRDSTATGLARQQGPEPPYGPLKPLERQSLFDGLEFFLVKNVEDKEPG